MTILPIQFRTKFTKKEFESLNTQKILDIVQEFLEEEGFNYIKRTENKISFHKANGWSSLNFKSFLVSGIVKVKEKKDQLTVISGNWMVLLISLPFLILFLLSRTKFSTLDENDLTILWNAFLYFFIGNLIIRVFAHIGFSERIEELIKKNYAQHGI